MLGRSSTGPSGCTQRTAALRRGDPSTCPGWPWRRTLAKVRRRAPGRFTSTKQWCNTDFLRCPPMDVVVVRWPAEVDRREQLRKDGRPRLLLLEDGVQAPAPADCLED